MKDFFNNKLNVLLLTILIVLLGTVGVLVKSYLTPNAIQAIDFSHLTKAEIEGWFEQNGSKDMVTFEYEFSDEFEKDKVVYQSVKDGNDIEDGMIIVISKGMDPDKEVEFIELYDGIMLDEVEEWLKNNGFSDITIEYVLSDEYEKGVVLNSNHAGLVKRSAAIVLTVSAGDDPDSVIVEVPDFSNMSKNEVSAWASANMVSVKFTYELSDTIAKDKVIAQSVEPGTKIKCSESITVRISEGKGVVMVSFIGKNKSDVQNWCNANGIDVVFSEEFSDNVASGLVVSQSIASGKTISLSTVLKVVISKGAQEKAVVPADGILGMPEADFVKKIKELNLIPVKSATTYFSTKLASGTIYSYDDGTFAVGSDVHYALSCGPYVFDASEYNGKKKSTVNTLVEKYNARNAHLTINYVEVANNAETKNRTYGCTINGNAITCNIAIEESVELANYVGEKSPCGKENACSLNSINFQVTTQYSDKYDEGIVISQSVSPGKVNPGITVKLTVSLGGKPVAESYIMDIGDYESYHRSDADSTISALKNGPFATFTNVTYKKASSKYGVGVIISISVNGNTGYTPGKYALNTPIVITVCSEQVN